MKRREFIKGLSLATLATSLSRGQAWAADRKPNIIYILADDLGYGDLSCFGQKKFKTPHIDKLATEGMRLTQHYSGSTVCAPSRSCLMTGLHTGHTPIRGNKEVKPVGQSPMPAATVTVAEILKKAGYATGCFGKWGLGFPGSAGDPLNQGFDTFFGYNCQRNAHNHYPKWLFDDSKKIQLDGKTYSQDLIMEKALAFVKQNHKKPFFCYLPVAIPHAAMQAPPEYHERYRKQFPQFDSKVGKYGGAQVNNPVAGFPAMMEKLDEDIGRLMALLKELGIDEDTLVLFTSDNGPHMEGGHDPKFWDSNGPLTGHKRDLTEGGIRVPTIARWPGRIQAGSQNEHISAFWDFLPTACDVASVQPPDKTDGISFLPSLLGKEQRQHEYLYWEFHEQGGKRAVRMGEWKVVQTGLKTKKPSPIRLFNLKQDIGETKDLAAQNPEIVAKMKKIFKEAHTPSPVFGNWPGD